MTQRHVRSCSRSQNLVIISRNWGRPHRKLLIRSFVFVSGGDGGDDPQPHDHGTMVALRRGFFWESNLTRY